MNIIRKTDNDIYSYRGFISHLRDYLEIAEQVQSIMIKDHLKSHMDRLYKTDFGFIGASIIKDRLIDFSEDQKGVINSLILKSIENLKLLSKNDTYWHTADDSIKDLTFKFLESQLNNLLFRKSQKHDDKDICIDSKMPVLKIGIDNSHIIKYYELSEIKPRSPKNQWAALLISMSSIFISEYDKTSARDKKIFFLNILDNPMSFAAGSSYLDHKELENLDMSTPLNKFLKKLTKINPVIE